MTIETPIGKITATPHVLNHLSLVLRDATSYQIAQGHEGPFLSEKTADALYYALKKAGYYGRRKTNDRHE